MNEEHKASFRKKLLGYQRVPRKALYGYDVMCSCGWKDSSNEGKRDANYKFKKHLKEVKQ
jgi:hypothetical protein